MTAAVIAIVGLIIRVWIAFLLSVAAIGKLSDLRQFGAIVQQYQLMPRSAVPMAAATLAGAELAIAAALPFDAARAIAVPAAAALLVLFAAAILINVMRGRTHIDCGCTLGGPRKQISVRLALSNLGLAGLVLVGLAPTGHLPDLVIANCVLAGLLLFGLYQMLSILFELRGRAKWKAVWSRL